MSTSGMLLKKIALFNPQVTLGEITSIMDSLGFNYSVDPITSEPNGFQLGTNDPKCNSDFCMFIFDKPKTEYMEDDNFAWISPNLYVAILIEDLCGSEDSVLKMLHKYFHLHPSDFFYAEEDWFYTKAVVDKIYESGEWYHWCYKNPNLIQ